MSEPAERFALARRGLPLPVASHATLKGAWLPAAARNRRAPEPIGTIMTVASAAAAPADEEPWWMEASEMVPRNAPVGASMRVSPSTTEQAPGASRHAERSDALASAVMGHSREAAAVPTSRVVQTNDRPVPQVASENERAHVATHARPEIITTPMRETAAPPSTRITVREAEQPPAPARQAAIERNVDRSRDDHAVLRPAAAPAPNVSVSVLGEVESRGHAERAPTSRPATRPAARAESMRPQSVTSAPLERLVERVHTEPSESAAATMASVRVEIMGASSPAAMPTTPATANLSSLLAPVHRNAGEIRIDRVAVTVQSAGTRQTPSTPTALAGASAAALPERAYRNPWASYFARRD